MATQPHDPKNAEEEGGFLSTILVGVALLGLTGWFIFGRGDDARRDVDTGDRQAQKSGPSQPGSIGAREVDPASAGERSAATVPATRNLVNGEPQAEPEPKTIAEKIERAERDLRRAKDRLTRIERSLERFDETRERAMADAKNPEYQARIYDRKAENIAKNLELTRDRVEELEETLANLRAGNDPKPAPEPDPSTGTEAAAADGSTDG